jgi:hypothetical protein
MNALNDAETSFWKQRFHVLLDIKNDRNAKYQIKTIFPKILCAGALAVHCAVVIASLYHPVLNDKINKCKFISTSIMWDLIKFIVGIWPQWIPHFISATKWWNDSVLQTWDVLGADVLCTCINLVFGLSHIKCFESLESFVNSCFPVSEYRLNSGIKPVDIPPFMKYSLFDKHLWNTNKNNNHLTSKYTVVGTIINHALWQKHRDLIAKVYGNACFTANMNFQVDVLRACDDSRAVRTIMSNYNIQSNTLTATEEEEVSNSLKNLDTFKFEFGSDCNCIGLTPFFRENSASGMFF